LLNFEVYERQVELGFLKRNQIYLGLSESSLQNVLLHINGREHAYLPGKHIDYLLCRKYKNTFSRKIMKQIITFSSLKIVFAARNIVLVFVLVDELCGSPHLA
jgi:hypothetical protein